MDKTVLIVEDNADDLELTLRSFKRHGIANSVAVARDGEEALHYLLSTGPHAGRTGINPVLILLDLKLPKVDGQEVLEKIRSTESLKRIPVVMLTTSDHEADKLRSYDAGVNSYIRKPVDFDQFLEMTRQLGIYWLAINDPPPPG